MLSEAAATGRPVHIFDLGRRGTRTGAITALKSVSYRTMMALLPKRLSRDIGLFHEAFVAAGLRHVVERRRVAWCRAPLPQKSTRPLRA